MNNTCKVDIDGSTYFIPCDRVEDLYFTGTYLVNVSSSNITLKSVFKPDNEYPYITCSSMSVCRLRTGNNNHYITSNYTLLSDPFMTFNFLPLIFIVLFITLGVRLVWKR